MVYLVEGQQVHQDLTAEADQGVGAEGVEADQTVRLREQGARTAKARGLKVLEAQGEILTVVLNPTPMEGEGGRRTVIRRT